MNNVINLYPSQNVPDSLRSLADEIQREIEFDEAPADLNCTVIIGEEIWHFGTVDDEQACKNAIYSMTVGQHKLMKMALANSEGG